jgi:hypothetical protein
LVNQGYSLSANELLKQHNEKYSSETHSLVIDFHPNSNYRIGLIEIEKIHIYTFGEKGVTSWSPMMLELKEIFYEEEYENLTNEEKSKIINEFEIKKNGSKIVEFLYLNGSVNSWNWGRNGMTNASFIHEEPRKYFKNFF